MAVTGENPDDVYTLCRAVGMDGFISKPYTMTSLKRNLIQLLTQGHCWKEGPAERLLDLKQLDDGMRGRDEMALSKSIKEARLSLLAMRTQLAELSATELADMVGALVHFAQVHGFVHLAPPMRVLWTAAKFGDGHAHVTQLTKHHDLFEVASQAALAWYRQQQVCRFPAAA
jgi:CheY-like chemotaxis protein